MAINQYNSELNRNYVIWKKDRVIQRQDLNEIQKINPITTRKLRSRSINRRNNYVKLKSFHEGSQQDMEPNNESNEKSIETILPPIKTV